MLAQVKNTIYKYQMIKPGDRVLVGVSGGPDSVALLHVLKNLSQLLNFEIFVAHLDHCLRGTESAGDAHYVEKLASIMNVQSVVEKRDVARYALVNKLSIETAAREVRYCFFRYAAEKFNCNKLATGHNANDQTETVLLNLLRGSGTAGLGGIPPIRDNWIIRPLIEVKRNLIEKYCFDNHLETRLDKSNLESVYTRNNVRLNLIPMLEKEYNRNLVETLVRTSEIFREEDQYIEEMAVKAADKAIILENDHKIELSLENIAKHPAVLQKRIIRRAWSSISGSSSNMEYIHTENAMNLITKGQTGAKIDLPQGITLLKSYDKLILTNQEMNQEMDHEQDYYCELKIPGYTNLPGVGTIIETKFIQSSECMANRTNEIYVDYDLIAKPIAVRSRRLGDYFKPTGMEGTKKIKSLLIDSKIPRNDRWKVPVVVSGDNKIIWVAGLRGDRRWQVTDQTKNALRIKLILPDKV